MIEILNEFCSNISPIFYKMFYMSIVASLIGIMIVISKKIFKNNITPLGYNVIWLIFVIALIFPIKFEVDFIKLPSTIQKIDDVIYEKSSDILIEQKNEDNNIIPYLLKTAETEENVSKTDVMNLSEVSTEKPVKEISGEVLNDYSKTDILFAIFNKIVPLLWFIGVIVLFIVKAMTLVIFRKKIGNKQITDERIVGIFNSIKEKYKIKREIYLIEQDKIDSFSIYGIFKVKILLNKKIYNMPDKQIEHVLMHELSHYKKKDNITNEIINSLRIVYWFNPLIWYMFNKMKEDVETLTDKLALKYLSSSDKKNYCITLLSMLKIDESKIVSDSLRFNDVKDNLEKRIRVIKSNEWFENHKKKIISITVILFVITTLCLFSLNVAPKTYSYTNPIVPEGFKRVDTEIASWKRKNGVISGWKDGLVIEDTKGNQFVWVPIDNKDIKYTKNEDDLSVKANLLYDDKLPTGVESEEYQIKKYGGFYISRHDIGMINNELASNSKAETIEDLSYTKAKQKAESMYSTTNLKSGLVTGTQFDIVQRWLSGTSNYEKLLEIDPIMFASVEQDKLKFNNMYSFTGKNRIYISEMYNKTDSVVRDKYDFYQKNEIIRKNMNKGKNNKIVFRTVLYIQ